MARTVSVTGTFFLFLVLCCLSGGNVASADDRRFTLQQAVAFACLNNGELKALRGERGLREAGKIRAGLYPNPVAEMDVTTGALSGSPSENRVSLSISQEFLTMGKREKRVRVADKEFESFDRQIENSERLLVEEVKTTFFDLLLAGKRVELAERFRALSNQLLEVTEQRLDAGDIPELEVNLARVEVARSEEKKVEAERELFPLKARLLALLGLPRNEDARFIGTLEGKPFPKGLAELKASALAKRPDIRALQAEKEKGDAEIALAQAERIPNITAGVGYQRENTAIDVAGREVRDGDTLIGLKVSIPIPIFDRNQAGIREAHARRESTGNRYSFVRLTAEREVEAAFARLTAAEKTLSIYTSAILPQLEENLKLVQESYRLGEVGILSVIEEQKKFFEVNDGYLSALSNRQAALVKLEAAVGTDWNTEFTGGEK